MKIIKSVQKEELLKILIEQLPKKKNGALHIKRTVEISPLMVMNNAFNLLVLCIKSIKDYEVEISLKEYNFTQINQFYEFLERANNTVKLVVNSK